MTQSSWVCQQGQNLWNSKFVCFIHECKDTLQFSSQCYLNHFWRIYLHSNRKIWSIFVTHRKAQYLAVKNVRNYYNRTNLNGSEYIVFDECILMRRRFYFQGCVVNFYGSFERCVKYEGRAQTFIQAYLMTVLSAFKRELPTHVTKRKIDRNTYYMIMIFFSVLSSKNVRCLATMFVLLFRFSTCHCHNLKCSKSEASTEGKC